jgi:predicted nuclease of predicted toxin-antitoxin system
VKILLDENMPESLLGALEDLGHEVDSVNHLKLKGLDNGTLYRQVAIAYDLCFTRDTGFAHNVRQMRDPSQVKILRVVFPNRESSLSFPRLLMLSKDPIGSSTQTATIGPRRLLLQPVQIVQVVQWFGRLTMTGSIFRSS